MAPENSDKTKARSERARKMVKRITANKEFMKEIEEGLESQRQGKGVPFNDVQRQNAGR